MKRTDYIGEFIYEDNVLQFIQHEEGRIVEAEGGGWEYQYSIKDHLGNTRVTFTTEPKTRQYDATMETAFATEEEALFDNLDTRHNDNALDHTDAGSTYTYSSYLTGTGSAIVGPAISLAVMGGDKLTLSAYGKFEDAGSYSTAVAGTFAGELANALDATNLLIETAGEAAGYLASPISALHNAMTDDPDRPRAYINYILFDQHFTYLSSGFDRIDAIAGFAPGNPGSVSHDQLSVLNVDMEQSGYAFIWLSNETANSKVWFDDLQIFHQESPIIQVDDYYPFGLSMASSYQRVDALRNRYLYNEGSELQEDFGLGLYQTKFRMLDPVLGRWIQVDPVADSLSSYTPYNSMDNNPIRYNDPNGDCPIGNPNCNSGKPSGIFSDRVVNNLASGNKSASNIISIKGGVQAAGFGQTLKVGKLFSATADVKAFAIEGQANSNSTASLDASVYTAELGLDIGGFNKSAGREEINAEYNFDGGKVTADVKVRDDMLSDNEIAFGQTVGNISYKISANIDAINATIKSGIEATKEYFKDKLSSVIDIANGGNN